MRTLISRFSKCRSGQNLVEFSMVVIMLLALVIGIVEFGRAWNVYQIITNGAREGVRLASLPSGFTSTSEVVNRVNTYMGTGNLDSSQATVSVGGAGVDGGTGSQVSVTVSYPYSFLFIGPIIRLMNASSTVGSDVTIQVQAVMRNE